MTYSEKPRIKTNIKFYKGLDNIENKLYGFVTKDNGAWRGCRVTEPRKKIVFVDPSIGKDILPNVLYSCSLISMNSGNGFIAKSAVVLKFESRIIATSNFKKGLFNVIVKFGNKSIIFDPTSNEKQKQDIQTIANYLRNLIDLKDSYQVAEDFITNACFVQRQFKQYQSLKSRANEIN